jgi:hypothetical protein
MVRSRCGRSRSAPAGRGRARGPARDNEPARPRRYPGDAECALIMVASASTCCVCRVPRLPVQLHQIICVLTDALTVGERTRADGGHAQAVLDTRSLYQRAMRADLTAASRRKPGAG